MARKKQIYPKRLYDLYGNHWIPNKDLNLREVTATVLDRLPSRFFIENAVKAQIEIQEWERWQ